ncbi:MAG: nucleotidyltransferase domain-containing protein [Firmicutes bacterium]|nr:nucleotidyltransferase domain-containing protein [Bacillota bacterium]MCL5038487.1 nucleotidyltransferase domain-containing protein [Bacillota bacterium]
MPGVTAVYLFGSYLENREKARDIDLAVLLATTAKSQVDLFMDLYAPLAKESGGLEVDLMFLNSASLPIRFEVVSTGKLVYCSDTDRLTDFLEDISREYMDFRFHLEMGRKELYQALKEDSTVVQPGTY